jgi:hypothetical protein
MPWVAHNLIIMITYKLIIETDRLEISCKTPKISDEQKTCDMYDLYENLEM